MAKTPKTLETWEEYDLSTRALTSMKNDRKTPYDLMKSLTENYDRTIVELLRIPNCGRMTVNEILDALGVDRPQGGKLKAKKFKTEDELQEYIAADGINPDELDADSLRMLLSLVSRDRVAQEPNGRYGITKLGKDEIDGWWGLKKVSMTIVGPRTVLMDMIRALPDDYPYVTILEEELLRDLDMLEESKIELGG